MTRWVQVAVAGDVTEAEELQQILAAAGIGAQLEAAVLEHPESTVTRPSRCSWKTS